MGESVGSGSALYQITAFGGSKGIPVLRAIPQSPSTVVYSKENADIKYNKFLSLTGCSKPSPKEALQCIQGKTEEELQSANEGAVADATPFGYFHFGPSIDDDFIQYPAGIALTNGHFVQNIQIMTGHNTDEGLLFVDPKIQTDEDFHYFLVGALPSASEFVISEIETHVYPPPSDSTPYSDNHGR